MQDRGACVPDRIACCAMRRQTCPETYIAVSVCGPLAQQAAALWLPDSVLHCLGGGSPAQDEHCAVQPGTSAEVSLD